MKTLPLLLLGAGAVYLATKKSSTINSSKQNTIVSQIGSKEIGYKIVEKRFGVSTDTHYEIIIYDGQKSLDYAYNIGIKYANNGPKYVSNLLIGSQFELNKLTLEKDFKFIFNLLMYGYSGIASVIKNSEYDKTYLIPLLNQFILDLVDMGLNNEEFLKYFKVTLL